MKDSSASPDSTLIDLYRRMTPREKWLLMGKIYSEVRAFHRRYVQRKNPAATEQDIVNDWMEATLEPELYRSVREYMKARDEKSAQSKQPEATE